MGSGLALRARGHRTGVPRPTTRAPRSCRTSAGTGAVLGIIGSSLNSVPISLKVRFQKSTASRAACRGVWAKPWRPHCTIMGMLASSIVNDLTACIPESPATINVRGPTRRRMFDPRGRRVYHARRSAECRWRSTHAERYTSRSCTDAFEHVIRAHGFRIVQRWGGYAGERYEEGPELVVQFSE
jgi:hypothetical protein